LYHEHLVIRVDVQSRPDTGLVIAISKHGDLRTQDLAIDGAAMRTGGCTVEELRLRWRAAVGRDGRGIEIVSSHLGLQR
jgi:hypothetical protein